MSHLRYVIDGNVATLVLNHPPQNRIDKQMSEELAAAVEAISRSEAAAVLIRSEGPDFCCGGDIRTWPDTDLSELRALFEYHMAVFNSVEQLPLPVIAAVQGVCTGGGLELAIRADVIFAGESARFGHSEATVGIVTLLGGVYRVAECAGRARAIEWALTAEQIPAAVMADAGVVNHVVADHSLLKEATAFAQKVATGATRAHAAHKALLRSWAVGGIAAADQVMFDIAMPLFETADAKTALTAAVAAFRAGKPRPVPRVQGALRGS